MHYLCKDIQQNMRNTSHCYHSNAELQEGSQEVKMVYDGKL